MQQTSARLISTRRHQRCRVQFLAVFLSCFIPQDTCWCRSWETRRRRTGSCSRMELVVWTVSRSMTVEELSKMILDLAVTVQILKVAVWMLLAAFIVVCMTQTQRPRMRWRTGAITIPSERGSEIPPEPAEEPPPDEQEEPEDPAREPQAADPGPATSTVYSPIEATSSSSVGGRRRMATPVTTETSIRECSASRHPLRAGRNQHAVFLTCLACDKHCTWRARDDPTFQDDPVLKRRLEHLWQSLHDGPGERVQ